MQLNEELGDRSEDLKMPIGNREVERTLIVLRSLSTLALIGKLFGLHLGLLESLVVIIQAKNVDGLKKN